LSVAGAAGLAASPAAASTHRPCPPRGTREIARDRQVAVYFRSGPQRDTGATEACLLATGARMTLISGGGRATHRGLFPQLDRVVLAGPIVAFEENQFGVDSGAQSITVVDVARRAVLRELPDVGRYVDAGIVFDLAITGMVVAPTGSVAWITSEGRRREVLPPAEAPPVLSVHAAPVRGPLQVLDEGSGIGPETLTLSGNTLRWWDSGVLRTAPMP
jgi:hypothetical protein